MCAKGLERKLNRMKEEEVQVSMVVAFQSYGRHMDMVMEFKYIGHILTASDEIWPEVVSDIHKARIRWEHFSRILGRVGAYPWTSGTFYKEVFQATLLF